MAANLIEFWRRFDPDKLTASGECSYVHEEDAKYLETHTRWRCDRSTASSDDYIDKHHPNAVEPKTLHLRLLPVPYAGNIERAEIILLFSNPGCDSFIILSRGTGVTILARSRRHDPPTVRPKLHVSILVAGSRLRLARRL